MPVIVRQFRPDEWRLYKSIRLKALQLDPAVFGSNYARELAYEDRKWRENLTNASMALFGVFDEDRLIGMTGIYIMPDDPSTARLVASWLEKERRGLRLSVPMYEARIAWAKKQPGLKRISFGCRESNIASGKAGLKHGFVFTHAEDHLWPDGQSEPHHFYELRL